MGTWFLVEAGAIPDDDVFGRFVAIGQLAQEEVAGLQTDRRAEEELARAFALDFQGRVQMAPLIFGLIGRGGLMIAQSPDLAETLMSP